MPVTDNLGTRMKTYYEGISKTQLMRRCPVAIRIDGKAFHTFTRGFQKPFDPILTASMQSTMKYLCKNIQGCVFGYTQSDEITLILVDYQTLETSAWFDYEVQKVCSIAASMATMAFNKFFAKNVDVYNSTPPIFADPRANTYLAAVEQGAMFDARCFNIPKEEVCNLIYWRQLDATRNSIQMVGRANFSQAELQGCSCKQIQEKLWQERNINWNDFPVMNKRGTACFRISKIEDPNTLFERPGNRIWYLDKNMPILKGDDREYVDKHISFE